MFETILFASLSALAAGATSILAKVGVENVDSTLATALRTIVVLAFSLLMSAIAGSIGSIRDIPPRVLLFLALSGLATGASWLCYYRALQLGDAGKVAPVDKSSAALTVFLSFILLGEEAGATGCLGACLIAVGAVVMALPGGNTTSSEGMKWLLPAVLSAVFASLSSILGKVGIEGVESNLGTTVRTLVVLAMSWLMVLIQGKGKDISKVSKKSWVFLALSGITTGASWLCFWRAMQIGAASIVVPIDKLSVIVTVVAGRIFFHEDITKRAALGLAALVAGTLLLAL